MRILKYLSVCCLILSVSGCAAALIGGGAAGGYYAGQNYDVVKKPSN